MGKSSPKPPPPPDYAGAAREQGVANLEAARLTARLSNPNISTPLGGQRVTFGRTATNQAAYDAAMRQYQQALSKLTNKGPYTPPAQAESPAVLALKAPLAVLAGQTG